MMAGNGLVKMQVRFRLFCPLRIYRRKNKKDTAQRSERS